ncbi:MAG: ABC transporter permease [Gemmatimonadaceae bacterium]
MDTFIHDLRIALRALWRAPAFTIAAVLTLAVGIGANTAIFSVVDGVLLRPAPFANIDRLMMVWQTDRVSGTTREPSSIPDYFDFQKSSRRFSKLAAFAATEVNLTRRDADPSRLAALAVTSEFLQIAGIQPIAGRVLTEDETRVNGSRAVLISESLANDMFENSKAAIGQSILLNDVSWSVVGVLPRSADFGTLQVLNASAYGRGFAQRGGRPRVDVWYGLRANPAANRDSHGILLMGMLAPTVTTANAQTEMTRIATDLERLYPSNANRGALVQPLESVVFGPVRPALYLLLGSVAMVLLVACGNVANLMLVRGAHRMRETTVRIALGAGVGRLLRQFLVESLVLTTAGAALGLLIAQVGLQALLSLAPATLPRLETVEINARVLFLTFAVSVAVAVAFSCLPVFQTRRRNLQSTLRGGTARNRQSGIHVPSLRSALVVTELAIAVMLVVGAGLMVRSLAQLQGVDPGFHVAGVLKAEFQLPGSRYPQDQRLFPNWPASRHFIDEVQSRLSAIPGVQSVALAVANPLDVGFTSSIRVVGREDEGRDWPEPSIRTVSPSYFNTLGVKTLAGRGFDATDIASSAPVVVINESAKNRFFGKRDPVGQFINMWGAKRRIVGVVDNEYMKGLAEAPPPAVYMSMDQSPLASSILVKTSGDPAQFAATLRKVVREIDPQLPLFGVEPLSDTLNGTTGQRRFAMLLLVVFASAALLLAVIGVHGVLSYTVSQRTREIGIRIALGASAHGVQRLVVWQGARLTIVGLAIGLVGASALTGLLSTMLFGIGARDPFTFVSAPLILGIVAIGAAYLPARRASRTSPLIAMRQE